MKKLKKNNISSVPIYDTPLVVKKNDIFLKIPEIAL